MFTPEQNKHLAAPLDPKHVSGRQQSGRTLSYIEAWHAIAEANRIFGHDGWTRETIELKCVAERERPIGKDNAKGWGVSYVARVRVTVGSVVREGCGAGHGIDRDLGLAHESALKEAESDAMKRSLMTFGNPFGLALYDKTKANVRATPADEGHDPEMGEVREPSYDEDNTRDEFGINPAERATLRVLMKTVRDTCKTKADCDAWIAANRGNLEGMRKGAKGELWLLIKAISNPPASAMEALGDALAEIEDINACDEWARAYKAGKREVEGAPAYDDLHAGDKEALENALVARKEAIAEQQLDKLVA